MRGAAATPEAIVEFPPFRLDVASERLLRDERPVPLRPKTWAVLRHLVERRGFLVTRAELLDGVWQGAAVCDDNLTQSIAEIRHALGDNARKPRFLETVHGRGFRFLAAVTGPRSDRRGELAVSSSTVVGRMTELDRLTDLFAAAETGRRRVVFVTGEAGIGKTTLVNALLARTRGERRGVRIARGQSIEQYGLREAYLPVLEALERLARAADGGADVSSIIRRVAPSWAEQMAPHRGETASMTRSTTPERMLREVAAALEELTADRPLILALEDLHWSDPSTIDFVTRIAERGEPARLLLIGTYRPAEASALDHPVAQAKRSLEARGRALELPLEDLAPEAVTEYVTKRFSKSAAADDLARWVYRRSEGNPFLMVTLVDELAGGGEPRVPSKRAERILPRSLRAMIDGLLSRLAGDLRRMLDAASAAGDSFDAHAVAAALDLPVTDVEAACENLARRWGILRPLPVRDWPDGAIGGRYVFRHSLYREVLYEGLAPATRRDLHLRIGRRLESGFTGREGEIEGELALHFERGGDDARAIDYLERAARRALARAAFREASGNIDAALRIVEKTPRLADRPRRELELLRLSAVVLGSTEQLGSARLEPVLDRILEICTALGSRAGLCQAYDSLRLFHIFRGDCANAERFAAALRDAARGLGRKYTLLANLGCAELALWSGNAASTRDLLEPLLSMVESSDPSEFADSAYFGPNPLAEVHPFLAYALWLRGFADRAVQIQEQGLALAQSLADPFTLGATLLHSAYLRLLRGDTDVAATLSERLLTLSTEYGIPLWNSVARVLRGSSAVKMNRDRNALATVRQGLRDWIALGSRFTSPHYALLAESCFDLGEIEEGLRVVGEGFASMAPTLDRFAEAELWRLNGELISADVARRRNRTTSPARRTKATECLERAVEIAHEQGALAFELRALTRLAKLSPGGGARERLSALLASFTEGAETVDVSAARRVLAGS